MGNFTIFLGKHSLNYRCAMLILTLFGMNTTLAQTNESSTIDDTVRFGVEEVNWNDSLVTQLYFVKYPHSDTNWRVYDSGDSTFLVFEFTCHKDTCITNSYYQNGHFNHNQVSTAEGKLVSEKFYCSNGQVISSKDYMQNPQRIINYHCNGNKMREATVRDLYHWEGMSRSWYQNGQMEFEGEFLNDQKNGVWKYWNYRGKLIRENTYEKGRLLALKTEIIILKLDTIVGHVSIINLRDSLPNGEKQVWFETSGYDIKQLGLEKSITVELIVKPPYNEMKIGGIKVSTRGIDRYYIDHVSIPKYYLNRVVK